QGHHRDLRDRMSAFTDALLAASPAIPGLDESIVIPARRLHFTLGVMALTDGASEPIDSSPSPSPSTPRTLRTAAVLLEEIRPALLEMLDGARLRVALKSMDIVKPERQDLERAHVMWVRPSPRNEDFERLRKLSNFVHEKFKTAGLVVDDGCPLKVRITSCSVKLHCTVLNTVYCKPRTRVRTPFSYSFILTSEALQAVSVTPETAMVMAQAVSQSPSPGLRSVDFGEWVMEEVQICEMGSWGAEDEYVCVGRCPLV
ncbi:hypothetical protein BKA93DRAFT_740086, partial [Sparassis latifolia]